MINDEAAAMNRLAREQLKRKLLADILTDLTICEIEGWDKREYIAEIRQLIDGLDGDQTGGQVHRIGQRSEI